ncbi:TPR repeat protein [Mucilaginibacter frigoritolerans]|jgi:tetratricopeptide (TPR) repeat protein|uniref:TPR repeat protein n=1 Tax=Mucilaginibacter frigoritolerans TaxID=652788 RepID=A0A562TMH8_9SPHI|nr:tetratricopeptide repeat protein [Mucilaginibacter frigoritolerans]TWI94779.1 TPR repeat protein [Mucilaginibacter frigoritolerans]
MENTFFTKAEFNARFGKEMDSAISVYEQRSKSGMLDYSMASYDFVFISDAREKLESLGNLLRENYSYKIGEVRKGEEYWEISGDSTEFPVDESNLMYWALDLYCKGYKYDCKLDGYGAMGDPKNQTFADVETKNADYYFELAMESYNNSNLGMSIIHFSTAIKINPDDPNSWYSRAAVKDQLHTWKAARRDYDRAIELAPDFVSAIVNRAANKDEAGEYQEAIGDYSKAIELDAENEMAYFNRGNSKFNINDKKGACEDWNKAKELGAAYAQERIDKHCNDEIPLKKTKRFFNW